MFDKLYLVEFYLSIFLLTFSPLFAKLIPWEPVTIIFWRCLIAAVCLLGYLLCLKQSIHIKPKDRNTLLATSLFMIIHYATFYISISLSTVSIGIVSLYTFPLFISFLSPIILKESISFKEILSAMIVMIGIWFIHPDFSLSNNYVIGSLVGIISGLFCALRTIYSRSLVQHYSGSVVMFYQLLGCFLLIPFISVHSIEINTNTLSHLLLLSTVFTAFAHTLYVGSLKKIKPIKFGIISCLNPVLTCFWSYCILQEVFSIRLIVGILLILSVAFIETKKQIAKI